MRFSHEAQREHLERRHLVLSFSTFAVSAALLSTSMKTLYRRLAGQLSLQTFEWMKLHSFSTVLGGVKQHGRAI